MHPMVEVGGGDVFQLKKRQEDAKGRIPLSCQQHSVMFLVIEIKSAVVITDGSQMVVEHSEQMTDAFVIVFELPHQVVD
jgi:hypothetical protein